MSKTFFLFAILAIVAAVAVAERHHGLKTIPNEYIVTFRRGTTEAQRQDFLHSIVQGSLSTKTMKTWAFEGFSAALVFSEDSFQLKARSHPSVLTIEPNAQVKKYQSPVCNRQSGATWGINRVNDRNLNLNGQYIFDRTGLGVDAYVIDTGVLITHKDFTGANGASRAVWGANFEDTTNTDCDGHGTHVAGTIGGNTYGIAKNVTIIAVKVLDCLGFGSYEGIISGMQWVATQSKTRNRPSVANMSLGGSYSAAVNEAAAAMIRAGVVLAVASGNDDADACYDSPGSTPECINIGSSNKQDDRSYYSNWGQCVHLFAPGESITSTWIGSSNTATRTISGTSMAAPHVAGVAALYRSANPTATPAQVKAAIIDAATPDKIDYGCIWPDCNETPNLLLFSACAAK